jgi:hypothetical protein
MELYVRFISTLAFGLIGLGAVLKVLLETTFEEWDAFNDIAGRVALAYSGKGGQVDNSRAEDILMEAEHRASPAMNTRMTEVRRREMNEMDEIETQLTQIQSESPSTVSDILPS